MKPDRVLAAFSSKVPEVVAGVTIDRDKIKISVKDSRSRVVVLGSTVATSASLNTEVTEFEFFPND